MLIYKLTNTVTNQVYIGGTTKTLEERLRNHRNKIGKDNMKVHTNMKQYGYDKFKSEVLVNLPDYYSRKDMHVVEDYYIKLYIDTYGKDIILNTNYGAFDMSYCHTKESRRKSLEGQKKYNMDKYGDAYYQIHTKEAIKKSRESRRSNLTQEYGNNYTDSVSPEARAKISESCKADYRLKNGPIIHGRDEFLDYVKSQGYDITLSQLKHCLGGYVSKKLMEKYPDLSHDSFQYVSKKERKQGITLDSKYRR